MTDKTSTFGKFVRDPLFHFLVAGALVYAGYYLTSEPAAAINGDERTVVVTSGEIEWLSTQWQKRWNRPPTEEELDGLITQHVRETVFYREALAMGLDKDDVVIRRRLGQKLEFLSQDLLQPSLPGKAELRSYFDENLDRYRAEDRVTMSHVFFDPDLRGDKTLVAASLALATLEDQDGVPDNVRSFGDPFLLQSYYPGHSQSDLARLFGSGFADPVFLLEPGIWHGPVLSGYGTHLVYVHDHSVSPPPDFENVADRVAEDWVAQKRDELNEQFTAELLDGYNVVIEGRSDAEIQPDQVASQ